MVVMPPFNHSREGAVNRINLLKLGKNVGGEAGVLDMLGELFDGGEAVVGHLLLANAKEGGDVAIGPALHQQQLDDLEAEVIAFFLPVADHSAQTAGDGLGLQRAPLLAAGHARSGGVAVQMLLKEVAR